MPHREYFDGIVRYAVVDVVTDALDENAMRFPTPFITPFHAVEWMMEYSLECFVEVVLERGRRLLAIATPPRARRSNCATCAR